MTLNRHERRRQAATFELRQVPISESEEIRCGWRGCRACRSLFDGLPPGWSNVIGYANPVEEVQRQVTIGGKPRAVLDLQRLTWRHDVTLCPEHTRALADLLYADPNPLLSQTAGQA